MLLLQDVAVHRVSTRAHQKYALLHVIVLTQVHAQVPGVLRHHIQVRVLVLQDHQPDPLRVQPRLLLPQM